MFLSFDDLLDDKLLLTYVQKRSLRCKRKTAWKNTEDFSNTSYYNEGDEIKKKVMDIDVKQKNGGTLNGVYEQMSEIIGFDNVVKLYDNFKGSQINFPTRLFSKEFVLQEALKTYDGTSESINLIATKYSYSERTIRKLLKAHLDSIQQKET